jgi:hypothetical protein
MLLEDENIPMFMDQHNSYHEKGQITDSHLQI